MCMTSAELRRRSREWGECARPYLQFHFTMGGSNTEPPQIQGHTCICFPCLFPFLVGNYVFPVLQDYCTVLKTEQTENGEKESPKGL